MAKERKSKKTSLLSVFFTAEVFGLALALLCVLSFLCLVTGDVLFGDIGKKIASFYLGIFGYLAFPILIGGAFIGVKALIGFKLQNQGVKRFIKYFSLYAFFIGLLAQSLKTPLLTPFNEYLAICYNSATSYLSCAPGGALLGLIANPVASLISPVGAYVVYALALVIVTLFLSKSKILSLIENSQNNAGERKNRKPSRGKTVPMTEGEVDENNQNEQPHEEGQFDDKPPRRTVIFGGGEFERKTPDEKKKGGSNVKVLFGGSVFNPTTVREPYSNPLQPTSSYRKDYEADIDEKTQFVKAPYGQSGRGFVSPMGRDDSVRVPSSDERMDIDVSEPEKDIYVFNTRGKTGERITTFDRRSGADGVGDGYNSSSDDNGYNVSRFSSGLSRGGSDFGREMGGSRDGSDYGRDVGGSRDGSDFGRDSRGNSGEDFGRGDRSYGSDRAFERDTRNPSDYGREVGGSRAGSDFGRDSRGNSGEDFGRGDRSYGGDRGFERDTRNPSDYGRDVGGSRGGSDYGRDVGGSRAGSDYGRDVGGSRDGSDFGRDSRGNSGEDFGRGDRSYGGDRAFERDTRNPSGYEQPANGSSEGEQTSFGANPITRAMRESGDFTATHTEEDYNSTAQGASFGGDSSSGEVVSDYSGDGSTLGGSYFSAEEKNRKPIITRDRSHHTQHSAPTSASSSSASTAGISSLNSGPIRGKQISMSDIPEENQFVNPIDNIPKNYKYAFPPISLLLDYAVDEKTARRNQEEQQKRAETIYEILKNAHIDATIEDIKCGPAITRFELSIPPTVSVKKIIEKYDDLNLWLAATGKIRLVAPIQNTSRIGIEVPNAIPSTVGLKGLIESKEFKTAKQSTLSFCLGQDIIGRPVVLDISKMPHLLVAGATGTGKSVFLNTLLVSLLYKYSPEELRIILVDPKIVEFSIFRGIPNLMFNEIFTDNAKVCSMLEWAVQEMEERYKKLNEVLAKNIDEYNAYAEKKKAKKIPKILIIIDEFADLMNSSNERKLMENKISRLAAKARAAGIHLIMATQRPSADIMEGSIKTNFTSRIAFKMSSPTDAMVIMGEAGADKLLGRGDVLYRTSTMPSAERAQGCFVDTPEIERVCRYVKENNDCYYDELALEKIIKGAQTEDTSNVVEVSGSGADVGGATKSDDELIKRAMRIAISTNNLSISGMQRKLGIGFPKAGKLMDTLVEKGYISEAIDSKTRKVLMTKEQFEEIFGEPF